ncbi:hypothetical protein [Roseibium hamelinense]|nr:hypothetical protein [Roseibium hamelinense]
MADASAQDLRHPQARMSLMNGSGDRVKIDGHSNCAGRWAQAWPAFLDPGRFFDNTLLSSFPNSVACQIRVSSPSGTAHCRYVVSRLKTTLAGPWKPGKVAVPVSRKFTCTSQLEHTGVAPGDFAITLDVQ